MASQHPPTSSDDMILFALEQALREVWAVLKAHDPHGYLDKDQDLQKAIADKLMALADFGVTDPQELRRRTLENFDFKPNMPVLPNPPQLPRLVVGRLPNPGKRPQSWNLKAVVAFDREVRQQYRLVEHLPDGMGKDFTMSQTKQSLKRKHRACAVPLLGAAGLSLSLASGAPAATVGPAAHEITLGEEEISDVSLATFYVFDKENARIPGIQLAKGGCGHGCGHGCGGCGHGCGHGCRGCGHGCGGVWWGGCGGCGGCSGGYWCWRGGVRIWCYY